MKLVIGYSGDKNAVKRSIPIRTYQERWPGTSPSLLYCRPGETTPYIVSGATVSGGTLTWTISATDAEKSGPGYAQVIFSNPAGTVVGHGEMIDIEVLKSIGEASTAPTPLQVWQTEAARIQALYQQIFDDYNAGRLTGPKGDKGDPGTPGTPGAAGANGRDGRDGRDGSDANVTSENIKAALGVDVVQAISNAEEQIDELDEGKADSNHVHTWEEIQERPTIPAAYDDTALSGRVSELQSDITAKQDAISDLDSIRSNASSAIAEARKIYVQPFSATCKTGYYYDAGGNLVNNANSLYIDAMDVSAYVGKQLVIGWKTYNGGSQRYFGFKDASGAVVTKRTDGSYAGAMKYNATTGMYEIRYTVTGVTLFYSCTKQAGTAVVRVDGYSDMFYTKSQIDTLVKGNGTYAHFSLDDCLFWTDLIANEDTYNTPWQNPLLGDLKAIHDEYGTVFSLYCYTASNDQTYSISDVPTKWAGYFKDAAGWLRFGYHDYNNFNSRTKYPGLQADYNAFTTAIYNMTGTTDCIARVVRTTSYEWGLNSIKILRDSQSGISGLLAAHDTRNSYYLDDTQNAWIQNHAVLNDYANGLIIIKTTAIIDDAGTLSDYVDKAHGNFARHLEFFGHNYNWGVTGIKGRFISFSKGLKQLGYKFEFPEDTFRL